MFSLYDILSYKYIWDWLADKTIFRDAKCGYTVGDVKHSYILNKM